MRILPPFAVPRRLRAAAERLAGMAPTLALAAALTGLGAGGASAQEFLANQIEGLVSSDTLKVEITGLSGAFSGNLRIESVTASDPQGVFLTAKDLALDWSPLALVRKRVTVEALTAGQIVLERLPQSAPADPNAEPGASSGLPNITADIGKIAVGEFVLGEAIAGTRARLSANARLVLDKDPAKLEVGASIQRLDKPGQIEASLAFAPADNRLDVTVKASEPAGGLVATLLKLPGAPPVDLTVAGSGALSNFMANGALVVGGEPAANLTARVNDVADGRRIAASLSVAAERFAPEAYAAYVRGGANLDVALTLRNDGVIAIDQGQLASDSVSVTAAGLLDRTGAGNALDLAVTAPGGGSVPLRFGTGASQTVLDVTALKAKLAGGFRAADIDLTATLPTAGYGPYVAKSLDARAQARGFDVTGLAGSLRLDLKAASVVAPDGVAGRFLEGPVTIAADGALGANGITLASSRITTGAATAAITGTAALSFSTFDLKLSSDFKTLSLSAAAVPLAGERLAVSGAVARTADGTLAASGLDVRGTGLSINGSARLAGDAVTADVKGSVDAAPGANAGFTGKADFALKADGPLAKPDIDLSLASQGLKVGGRELANLKLAARGDFVSAAPSGTVDLSGTLDSAPLSGTARVDTRPDGRRHIGDLAIRQGPNTIDGDITLTEAFVPVGSLGVDITDVGPLAALALQQASGDLRGTIALSVNPADLPVADVTLASQRLGVTGNTLTGIDIALAVEDYLGRPFPSGTIAARTIEAGGARVEALAVALDRRGDGTHVAVTARANGVPVALAGDAAVAAGETRLALDSLTADIPAAAVKLRERATVRIKDGTTRLDPLTLDVGAGSLALSGLAGPALDLRLALTAVPAAVANPFVQGLQATGTVEGTASVSGASGDPQARFDIRAGDIETSQTRAAKLPPLRAALTGSYAKATLALAAAEVDLGEGSLSASGTVGEALDLSVTLDRIPASLANGFVTDLDASGTLSGSAKAAGTLADPAATFRLNGAGITAAAVAAGGVPPIALETAGSFAGRTLKLDRLQANVGAGSLTASGTAGDELDLRLALVDIPVGLANGFVPGLKASGTLNGRATATGTLARPSAAFDLAGTGITAEQVAAGGIPPLELKITGSFADGTAKLDTALATIGKASLRAAGRVGQALDLDVTLDAVPVGLVNGFVPGLKASGTISGSGTATGTLTDPTARFQLNGSGITAEKIAASGIAPLTLDLAGHVEGRTATIERGLVTVGEGSLKATGTVGQRLDLALTANRIPVGLVNGFAPDLGASGLLSGRASATGTLADPSAEFRLSGTGITAAGIAASGIKPITLDVDGSFAKGTATLRTARADLGEGSLSAFGTVGQALDLDVALTALPVGLVNGFVPNLGASGTLNGSAKATGSLADPSATFTLRGTGITTRQVRASGVAPIVLDVAGRFAAGTATIETARAVIGDGSLSASGTVGQALDLKVALNKLPVGLANGFVPSLKAAGSLSGTASATGSLAEPAAAFDISASGLSTEATRQARAPAVGAVAKGRYAAGTVSVETARVTVGRGTVTITGTAGATLALDVAIANLPASLASAAATAIDPAGTINGTVKATGAAADPNVAYRLDVAGLSLKQTREAGVGPLAVGASGQFANKVATLDATLSGNGLAFKAGGSVNVAGTPQLNLSLNGTVPLALGNRILAEGGRSAKGTVRIDVKATGAAAAPNLSGTISTSGASFTDTGANLSVNAISTVIALDGQTATIRSFSAKLASGGTIAVGGTVGLAGGFPANVSVKVANGRYNDGELLAAAVNADLTLTGSLSGGPRLAGTVDAAKVDVLVPEKLPTSLARIDVTHRNAPKPVVRQQADITPKGGSGGGSGGGLSLDVALNAPSRVFVRGRGLDIELGGRIEVQGSASSPSITGGFDLRRGRFRILSNRLDFQRGRLSFTGDLLPTLDLLATSDTGGVTVSVAVTGPANDPSFNFSSQPALPQDEVLARLIFGQGTANLSPLQIAQLAEAAATLAGAGGSSGLLENLRSQLGVDDLDIKTTADGQTSVGVGKYLNDRTYLGVDSTGRVAIDLDLGKGLKARGAVTATGGGEVGVFYENEY